MSSNQTSPVRRSILSPKPSNLTNNNSPLGKRFNTSSRLTPSPSKSGYHRSSATPSPKKQTLGFTIWEDKVDKSNSTTDVVGTPTSNKLNHNDQENILQPKKVENKRFHNDRQPLSNLSINEFKGFISTNGAAPIQLTELYQPINFNNEFKSLHKQLNIPSYVTPSRRYRDKYLVKSGIDEIDEEIEDEMELLLSKKQQQRSTTLSAKPNNINKTHLIRKHTRSLTVGKNDSKLSLIRKNKFSILSN